MLSSRAASLTPAKVGSILMMSRLAFLCQRPDMFQKGGENVAGFFEDVEVR